MAVLIVPSLVMTGCSAGDAPATAPSEVPTLAAPPSQPSTSVPSAPTPSAPQASGQRVAFYLDAAAGCYSLSADPAEATFIEGVGKEFYPRPCAEEHNFEVFWSTDIEGFDAQRNLSQDDAGTACRERYTDVFGAPPPQEVITAQQQEQTPYILWFFPDDGLEAMKYPGRLVCGVFVSDPEVTRLEPRTGSLVPTSESA